MRSLVLSATMTASLPALVSDAGERAGVRFLEFFTANIRNPNTRRAYARATNEFLTWCAMTERYVREKCVVQGVTTLGELRDMTLQLLRDEAVQMEISAQLASLPQ